VQQAQDDESLFVPKVTVAVDWQKDPETIKRDFGVIVSEIRHLRRAFLKKGREIQVAEVINELRQPDVRRERELALRKGEKVPVRVMEFVAEGAGFPSARAIAEKLGPASWAEGRPERVKRILARYKATHSKLVSGAVRKARRQHPKD
jgi:hypothetical protein